MYNLAYAVNIMFYSFTLMLWFCLQPRSFLVSFIALNCIHTVHHGKTLASGYNL